MSFQAYLENIKAKTSKTPDDFQALANKKGLVTSGEIVAWLKEEFKLGHGHARAIAHLLVHKDERETSPDDKVGALFEGGKARWRSAYDTLTAKIAKFGTDVEISANQTYINVNRGKKFAIIQPSASSFDIGIKLKGVAPSGRLEAAGSWNNMVTHRVRIRDPKEIDKEVLAWLKQGYDAAPGISKLPAT
jgi:hypothetical protein